MPESPKFLMTQGKNGKALHVFQMVHRINSGHNNYPVSKLKINVNVVFGYITHVFIAPLSIHKLVSELWRDSS